MLGPHTRASSKLKTGLKAIGASGSHQNGEHLLGPSPGSEEAHKDALYDLEEETMRMDVLVEELGNDNEDEAEDETLVEETDSCVYETLQKGLGIGAATRPTPLGFPGLSAGGGGGAITKKSVINDEEMLVEEEKRLELEVRHYEMLLTRAQVESMRNGINKLSLQKTNLSGFQDSRDRGGLAIRRI